jgi:hypothetical protein
MATCGTCKAPNQPIDHIRTCTGASATLPALELGQVVTLAAAGGYWLVTGTQEPNLAVVTQLLAGDREGAQASVHARDVEMVFANIGAAADYQIALDQQIERRKVRETLHGDSDYCRGCAKGWWAEKWHSADCSVIRERRAHAVPAANHDASGANLRDSNPWAAVDELRNQVVDHLHYETKQGRSAKRLGHFAVEVEGTLKFLVIKVMLDGRYAGRVFVDSMGSDTAYPVKAPATLTAYLTAVLVDPTAAAKRYADELGSCSDCNRPLTNEESRARGIGPECWAKR